MAGSATQATIKNFVDNYAHLPSWAQPDQSQLGKVGQAGLPTWAQKPPKGPSSFSQIGGGITPQQAAAQQKAQAAAAKQNAANLKAQQRAQAAQAKQQAQTQAAAQKQAAQAQAKAAAQSQAFALGAGNLAVGIGQAGSNAGDAISSVATNVQEWMASWPTPGGIGLLLLIIFVMLWVLIPVDQQGYTRLQLLWFTVMGRTELQGSRNQQNAETVAAMSNTTSPLLGVTSLAQNVQGTTQDFSVSPSDGTFNLSTTNA